MRPLETDREGGESFSSPAINSQVAIVTGIISQPTSISDEDWEAASNGVVAATFLTRLEKYHPNEQVTLTLQWVRNAIGRYSKQDMLAEWKPILRHIKRVRENCGEVQRALIDAIEASYFSNLIWKRGNKSQRERRTLGVLSKYEKVIDNPNLPASSRVYAWYNIGVLFTMADHADAAFPYFIAAVRSGVAGLGVVATAYDGLMWAAKQFGLYGVACHAAAFGLRVEQVTQSQRDRFRECLIEYAQIPSSFKNVMEVVRKLLMDVDDSEMESFMEDASSQLIEWEIDHRKNLDNATKYYLSIIGEVLDEFNGGSGQSTSTATLATPKAKLSTLFMQRVLPGFAKTFECPDGEDVTPEYIDNWLSENRGTTRFDKAQISDIAEKINSLHDTFEVTVLYVSPNGKKTPCTVDGTHRQPILRCRTETELRPKGLRGYDLHETQDFPHLELQW